MGSIETIKRDEICVGEVIKPEKVEQYPENHFGPHFDGRATNKSLGGQLYVPKYEFLRNMLYIQHEDDKPLDLLYESPKYPILNVSDKRLCLDCPIIVGDYWNLGMLLKAFGYPEDLNFEDIEDIPEHLFNLEFMKKECREFGWLETRSGGFKFGGRTDLTPYFDVLYARSHGTAFRISAGFESYANKFDPVEDVEGMVRRRVK